MPVPSVFFFSGKSDGNFDGPKTFLGSFGAWSVQPFWRFYKQTNKAKYMLTYIEDIRRTIIQSFF